VDRIGVVATDTLRVIGLQSILPQFEIIHLTAPVRWTMSTCRCADRRRMHEPPLELIATFHHIRPS